MQRILGSELVPALWEHFGAERVVASDLRTADFRFRAFNARDRSR
jgi:hypothetical protein